MTGRRQGKMPEGPGGRGFYLGLAIGQFWLTIIATVAASLARVWARTPAETVAILAIVIVVGLVLIVADAFLLRPALRLPPGPPDAAAIGTLWVSASAWSCFQRS